MEGGGRGWKFGWFLRWARGMALQLTSGKLPVLGKDSLFLLDFLEGVEASETADAGKDDIGENSSNLLQFSVPTGL